MISEGNGNLYVFLKKKYHQKQKKTQNKQNKTKNPHPAMYYCNYKIK